MTLKRTLATAAGVALGAVVGDKVVQTIRDPKELRRRLTNGAKAAGEGFVRTLKERRAEK